MSVQKSFTFYNKTLSQLNWTITDQSGNPISTANVTATLFWARDRINPEQTPGIAVQNFTNLALAFSNTTSQYFVVIPGLFDTPIGSDYVLAVDAVLGGNPYGHWERPAVVVEYGP